MSIRKTRRRLAGSDALLVVVPVLYTWLDALHERRLRRKAARTAGLARLVDTG